MQRKAGAARDRDRFRRPLVGVGATDVDETALLVLVVLVVRDVDPVVHGARIRNVEVRRALRVAHGHEMHVAGDERVENAVRFGPRTVQRVHDGRVVLHQRAADGSDDAGVVGDDVEPVDLEV